MKRCSGICLLVGTSGKGLGCSLTLEPVRTNRGLYTIDFFFHITHFWGDINVVMISNKKPKPGSSTLKLCRENVKTMIKEHHISTVQYIVAFLSRASRKSHNNKNTNTKQWSIVITIFFRTKRKGKGSKRDVGRKREQGNEQKETRTFPIRATDTKMRAYKCVQCNVNTSSAMLGRCCCVNLGVSLLPPFFGPGKHPSNPPC